MARELITQTGLKRGARYTLSVYANAIRTGEVRPRQNRRHQILQLLKTHSQLSKAEVSEKLGLNPKTVEHWLRRLKNEGLIAPTVPGRGSRNTRYQLTFAALQDRLFGEDTLSSS